MSEITKHVSLLVPSMLLDVKHLLSSIQDSFFSSEEFYEIIFIVCSAAGAIIIFNMILKKDSCERKLFHFQHQTVRNDSYNSVSFSVMNTKMSLDTFFTV